MRFGKMIRPCSLRARLMGMFVGGLLLSMALLALVLALLAKPFSQHLLDAGVQHWAAEVAQHVRLDAQGRPVGFDDRHIEPWLFNSLSEEATLRVVDAQGRVAYSSDRDGAEDALVPDGAAFDSARRAFTLARDGVAMHGATTPIPHAVGRWWLQMAISDRMVLRMRSTFGTPALMKGVVGSCVVFILIFFLTVHLTLRKALQPLRAASAEARRITPRTLDQRLSADAHPREIQPLVQAFNQTLERLQQGFRTQQEFLSSAAHELKTPLALIRAQVELGPDEEHRRYLLEDVDRMARQVQQLLMLAEVSEPQNYRMEAMDPRGTVQEVFDYMGRVAERRSVLLGLRVAEGLRPWQADRGALFTLLKNLLENAIQHSPTGGVVMLVVTTDGFAVRDEGRGVPQESLPRLFERFWRGPERREEGAGLGLSICREIAMAHRWQLRARNTGQGLEMTVEIDRPDGPAGSEWDGSVATAVEAPRRMPPVHLQSTSPGKAMLNALF
ncbi:signal transduction histidine kinase [Roseateles depolymerans]|uniref:histidine kinase n=2 Tax=Roseateles depolymerans TaxID=76731 RepID=A0A0U3MY49_9BURK|nr:Integral membrane sensor signal transduction histidine kinase [Roseateles depolymerans]REG15113.1 signal transduction histidine kinase [Roseateles depolymerans]